MDVKIKSCLNTIHRTRYKEWMDLLDKKVKKMLMILDNFNGVKSWHNQLAQW
jgi:hypothetical protein